MTTGQLTFSLTVSFAMTACSNQTADKSPGEEISADNYSTEITYEKLDIPKHWTEIKKQGDEWIFFIPCHKVRELRTVNILKKANVKAISCNFGAEGQWFAIKNIYQQADSLVFITVLPYDTSARVLMSMKCIDKEKNVTRWTIDGGVCTYVPTADTIKYKRVLEPCDSIVGQ